MKLTKEQQDKFLQKIKIGKYPKCSYQCHSIFD